MAIVTDERFKSRAVLDQMELADQMAKKIKDVVYEYANRMPLATAIGVLKIVSDELQSEAG